MRSPVFYLLLIPLAGWLIWNGRMLAGKEPFIVPSPVLFRKINIYLFIMMSLLSIESLLRRP